MPPVAIVMNLSYTGLGIARSLGERGVRVIGLTSQQGIYGNYTRYADVRLSPDSSEEPEQLVEYLMELAETFHGSAIIFPTRDDDVVFLDRYRDRLGGRYLPAVPTPDAIKGCLDKWETDGWAKKAGVSRPRSWKIESNEDLARAIPDMSFPCILKPLAAWHWRKRGKWELLGHRKAILVSSATELVAQYASIAAVESRALLQEVVAGTDDCLWAAGCYFDRDGNYVAGFTAHKLLQIPAGFGTGCVVQTEDRQELLSITRALLQKMGYTGLAEVEYKWDQSCHQFKLIEVNPRPWDQHRLGRAAGVDLIYIAYCDLVGLPFPAVSQKSLPANKWIADDVFILTAFHSITKEPRKLLTLYRAISGRRSYAVWSARDPVPFLVLVGLGLIPRFVTSFLRAVRSFLTRRFVRHKVAQGSTPI
jgi:D-aspartate ligase